MIPELFLWLIIFLPFISFAIISIFIRPLIKQTDIISSYISVFAISLSFILSLWALISVFSSDDKIILNTFSWIHIGAFKINFGLLLDPLSAVMLIVVTSVSLLVQIYSIGYMHDDKSFSRYFAYLSLFTSSMLGLVLSVNIIQLFIFWELVGLCSYLLIGFWVTRPSAAAASKKAFLMTRIGDIGFLIAILYLSKFIDVFAAESLDPFLITDLSNHLSIGLLSINSITIISIGIFLGAIGKSGQFPLHTWLPDAMEGPTPVSALIHAATMVAAGGFLVARFYHIFEASAITMDIIVVIGIITILLSAMLGLVMTDIKRVLAYSTVSQLGYMMLALGVGAYVPAIFHLFTHAYFKALLFLGSGNISHASGGTFDMRYFGGLRKFMPLTFFSFLIGSLSLSGIFPLAGFWSKDEILTNLYFSDHILHNYVFYFALLGAFFTALYMFRVIFLTFYGDFRGGAENDENVAHRIPIHLSDPPKTMVLPLIILASCTILFGYLVNPTIDIFFIKAHWLSNFLYSEEHHHVSFSISIAFISTVIAFSGILLSYILYYKNQNFLNKIKNRLTHLHNILENKYFIDYLYEKIIVKIVVYQYVAKFLYWFDQHIVDGVIQMVDQSSKKIAFQFGKFQTGQLQNYALFITIGILLIFIFFAFNNKIWNIINISL